MTEIVNAIMSGESSSPAPQSTPDIPTPDRGELGHKPESVPQDTPPVEKDRYAAHFAALSREKNQLLKQQQSMKASMAEFEEYKAARENAKQDPLKFLEKSGLKLEDVIYSGLGSKPEKNTEDKINELRELIEQRDQADKLAKEKSEQERLEQSIGSFKNDINKHIQANPEKYELINLNNAQHEVYSLIEAYLQKTTDAAKNDPTGELRPILMSIEEAADKIENYYEQHETEIFSKSKKLASKYAPIIKNVPKSNPTSPTLTNRNTLNPSATNAPETTYNSYEQKREASIRRAAQMLDQMQQRR